jgi:hypothetical protein
MSIWSGFMFLVEMCNRVLLYLRGQYRKNISGFPEFKVSDHKLFGTTRDPASKVQNPKRWDRNFEPEMPDQVTSAGKRGCAARHWDGYSKENKTMGERIIP